MKSLFLKSKRQAINFSELLLVGINISILLKYQIYSSFVVDYMSYQQRTQPR